MDVEKRLAFARTMAYTLHHNAKLRGFTEISRSTLDIIYRIYIEIYNPPSAPGPDAYPTPAPDNVIPFRRVKK